MLGNLAIMVPIGVNYNASVTLDADDHVRVAGASQYIAHSCVFADCGVVVVAVDGDRSVADIVFDCVGGDIPSGKVSESAA